MRRKIMIGLAAAAAIIAAGSTYAADGYYGRRQYGGYGGRGEMGRPLGEFGRRGEFNRGRGEMGRPLGEFGRGRGEFGRGGEFDRGRGEFGRRGEFD